MAVDRRPFIEWFSRGLIATGLVCLGWVALVTSEATLFRRTQLQAMVHMTAETTDAATAPVSLPPGTPLGVLSIPRIGFAEAVAEGENESTLSIAIGHLPDTPMPWHPGNSGFAGHRSTHFRPLKDVQTGDELVLRTPYGTFRYVVRQTLIVDPSEVSVLAPATGRQLTLVTCYPFTYIGTAPKRFVVRADGAR